MKNYEIKKVILQLEIDQKIVNAKHKALHESGLHRAENFTENDFGYTDEYTMLSDLLTTLSAAIYNLKKLL